MAGNSKSFKSLNPSFEILVARPPLPASLIALSPELADLDRNRLQQALIVNMTTADRKRLSLIVDRSLFEQSSVFTTLSELHGRGPRALTLQHTLQPGTITIESPHQLEIRLWSLVGRRQE